MAHRNPILGGTNYDPRYKIHSKPQRFKLMQNAIRIDSKSPSHLQIDSENSTRDFETSSSEIGRLDRLSLKDSKFAPQDVDTVLRFYAFFLEPIDESPLEQLRLRKSVLLAFIHDNTFEIQEPRVLNSGIPQGSFLKRCRLPASDGYFQPKDLFLGMEFPIYGRIFKLYDCDDFTRKYYLKMNWTLGRNIAIPQDEYTFTRERISKLCGGDMNHFYGKVRYPLKTFMEASLGNSVRSRFQSEKKRKFLANAQKTLCFHCEYDNRDQLYGTVTQYKLCYYLEDDSMEIKEVLIANSGRLPFPLLLKRCRVLKNWTEFLIDEQDRSVEEPTAREAYYNEEDLFIGAVLNIFGRVLKLVDSDLFTRDYYQVAWGIRLADSISTLTDTASAKFKAPSHGNAKLENRNAPKNDLYKMVEFDRKVLRFLAKMISERKEQAQRHFVIAYYLADDTIAIFEPEQRNSGIVAGKFLERGAHLSPDNSPYDFTYFKMATQVAFNKHRFEILDADEYTKKFMAA